MVPKSTSLEDLELSKFENEPESFRLKPWNIIFSGTWRFGATTMTSNTYWLNQNCQITIIILSYSLSTQNTASIHDQWAIFCQLSIKIIILLNQVFLIIKEDADWIKRDGLSNFYGVGGAWTPSQWLSIWTNEAIAFAHIYVLHPLRNWK